jgi:predicted  nucleic acid-binding Zn-ribbon protein
VTDQPEALRLADALVELDAQFSYPGLCGEAADELRRQYGEIERLNNALKKQAAAAKMGMDAATAISSQQLLQAAKLRAESSPDALESERAMNAILTAELEQLKTERDALKATLDDYMDDFKAVVNEQCAKNEKHCTCVPHLRQRIKEVEAERDAAVRELELVTAERNRAHRACEQISVRLHAAMTERDALRADAERYRWLLDCGESKLWKACADMDSYDAVEAAIDAAREVKP